MIVNTIAPVPGLFDQGFVNSFSRGEFWKGMDKGFVFQHQRYNRVNRDFVTSRHALHRAGECNSNSILKQREMWIF